VHDGSIDEEEAVKNADSANNVRLKLKLHRENPANVAAQEAQAAPGSTPAAPAAPAQPSWGLELKLEDIEADEPPEDPGRSST
jgi:twitching motility protein PilU